MQTNQIFVVFEFFVFEKFIILFKSNFFLTKNKIFMHKINKILIVGEAIILRKNHLKKCFMLKMTM